MILTTEGMLLASLMAKGYSVSHDARDNVPNIDLLGL